jgi:hypothetical protein
MHRNHPQTRIEVRTRMILEILCFPHTIDFLQWPMPRTAHATGGKIHPTKSFTAPLNPRRPTVGAPSSPPE